MRDEPLTLPTTVDTLVIGAGFSGLGAAIKLDQAGLGDFIVVDRGRDVGGTWRDNTYPGAACDVPSHLYSYSFAPNPNWTQYYSPQPEIHAYLQDVAEKSGTLDRFFFETTLEYAAWDDARQRWVVTLHRDETSHTVEARHLISGAGGLSEPRLPDIKGIEEFQGAIFHSAEWDHNIDLTGKRVAVIGTGASAIQIVPELQKIASHLDVHQRTAPWILPRIEKTYTAREKRRFARDRTRQRLHRGRIWAKAEFLFPAFTTKPQMMEQAEKAVLGQLKGAITDPELLAKVTPTTRMGCKRVLLSNAWYPALMADNTSLITDGISHITADGIVVGDTDGGPGEHRPVDVIVVCTGFHATDHPLAHRITGRDGANLGALWAEAGMAAYKGTTIHGFPNLFQIVGPNTALAHSSMVYMIESQVGYAVAAINHLRREGVGALEPKAEAQQAWNTDLQERMKSTVWTSGGCASWYLDRHGNNTVLWPRQTYTFHRLLSNFDSNRWKV